jgi:two-component system, OmpR family, sensor kinase
VFRSIRWTLQMWHAAILATVLVVFGWVVFYLVRVTTYQQIDAGLDRMADLVVAGLGPPRRSIRPRDASRPGDPLRPVDASRPGDASRVEPNGELPREGTVAKSSGEKTSSDKAAIANQVAEKKSLDVVTSSKSGSEKSQSEKSPAEKSPSEKTPAEKSASEKTPADRATAEASRGGPEGRMRGQRTGPRFELNEDFPKFFEEELGATAYFIVWLADGRVLLKSQSADQIPLPELHPAPHEPPVRLVRQRGELREIIHQGRRGSYILVGRSIETDLAALHEVGWLLGGVGSAVLAAGLIGGFWFSRRAIKPIEAISAAAADISLSNLSRRIDVSGTETELTGLARTLNQMIDRLESAFAQQVRFTADASHELRTPLAVILSHAELALDKTRPANELRETIETCRRSALRMKTVVESLLTLARFDSGELQLECRPIDLARLAKDCATLIRPLAEKRRISVELDLESAGLIADSDRLSQVVTNLLTNAIRYNHDDGRVVVTTRSAKGDVILNIADTGIGIGPEHLPHIFERFYRVDKARSRKDGGIGLGLAICKSIVEAHGGQISVTSNADGGSQFEVRLPKRNIVAVDEAHDSEETRPEPVAMSTKA